MTIEHFLFVGCLIVRWIDPLAKTPQMRRYRGVDRLAFSSIHLTPDGKLPEGRLAALCAKYENYESAFEYIIDPAAAVMLYRELSERDRSYELIACGIEEERLADDLQARSDTDIFGALLDEDDRMKFASLKLRLLQRPHAPSGWPVLGYDVSEFGHFYSPLYQEVLPGNFPEYDRHINSAGLFDSARIAARFISEYRADPHGEPGHYYIYEIRAAPS